MKSQVLEEKFKEFLFMFIDNKESFVSNLKQKYGFDNFLRINNSLFLTNEKIVNNSPLAYANLCLGFFVKDKFAPSNLLLKEIQNERTNKVFLDETNAVKFVYGKSVKFLKKKVSMPQKAFLVMQKNRCLGFGKIYKDKVKAFYDIGFTERLELKNHLNL